MTCRPEEGGAPKCRLGLGCQTVEIRGASWANVSRGYLRKVEEPAQAPGLYDVVIVGEAPGATEDTFGVPFQGEAGKKLGTLLRRSNLDLDRVFISNAVRCRPPKNRKPTVQEINVCRPYLEDEIRRIQPRVIMPLGNIALRAFNLHNEGGITKIRGKVFERPLPGDPNGPKYTIVPSLHPASFLYQENKQLESRVLDDYHTVTGLVQGRAPSALMTPEYRVIRTLGQLDELVEELLAVPVFSLDTESPNARWWEVPVICFSFCWGYPGKTAVVPIRLHDPEGAPWKLRLAWEDTRPVYERLCRIVQSDVPKRIHFAKYDRLVTRKTLGVDCRGKIWDTLTMHHLLDERPPHDLETLADIAFGYGDWSAEVRKIVGHGKKLRCTYDHIPDHILWPYTATDAEACFRLGADYEDSLHHAPDLLHLYNMEAGEIAEELIRSEWHGVPCSQIQVNQLITECKETLDEDLALLRSKTWPDFNPSSSQQVAKACKQLGFEKEITDKDTASGFVTDKHVLTMLASKDVFFPTILKYRNLSKLVNTYLENIEADRCPDGRLRYSWRIAGPATGRLAVQLYHQAFKINKRLDPERLAAGKVVFRNMFQAADGNSLVYADFSQVELRILAIESGDKELQRIYREGGDVHLSTAAEILGIPEEGVGIVHTTEGDFEARAEDNRGDLGKKCNFGKAYGSEGSNLIQSAQWVDVTGRNHVLTWDLLGPGMERWDARFTGAASFKETIRQQVLANNGVLVSRFGRRRHFGRQIRDGVTAALREAVNHPIQSAASSLTNRTIILVGYELAKLIDAGKLRDEDVLLLLTVHDSMLYQVRPYLLDWFCPILKMIAERPVPELEDWSFPISMGQGKTWWEAEYAAH